MPIIAVDFGTATTFDVISAAGEYVGGVICPGIGISADALFQRAARLPRVDVRKPPSIIGQTTVTSMQAGLFFGYVSMVDGIVTRIRAELPSGDRAVCIATGGMAGVLANETTTIQRVEPDLDAARVEAHLGAEQGGVARFGSYGPSRRFEDREDREEFMSDWRLRDLRELRAHRELFVTLTD